MSLTGREGDRILQPAQPIHQTEGLCLFPREDASAGHVFQVLGETIATPLGDAIDEQVVYVLHLLADERPLAIVEPAVRVVQVGILPQCQLVERHAQPIP